MSRVRSELSTALEGLRLRLRLANLLCGLIPQFSLTTLRTRVYRRLLGMDLGPGVSFQHTISVTGSGANPYRRLSVGANTIISTGVLFNLEGQITIGQNVNVSQFVRIYTSRHRLGPPWRRFDPQFEPQPVVIADGCWIGAGCTILPGVTIGYGSVVSAGSVVNRDVPPNTLVTGVPAVAVRELPGYPEEDSGDGLDLDGTPARQD
jgi:maltose O-acetyltransferase